MERRLKLLLINGGMILQPKINTLTSPHNDIMFLQTTPGRICIINNKEYLFCSGYGYLGMSHAEQFIQNVIEGVRKYGPLFPSSRNSNSQLELFNDMESALSKLTKQESAVIFSSGFLAGQTIAGVLSLHKNIRIAPGAHPAIQIRHIEIPGISFNEWATLTVQTINDSEEDGWILIADSVDILHGVVNDFSFLQKFSLHKKITVLIDDSHGIGILGLNGEGIVATLPEQANIEYIISYSLSKAFNIPGGAVSASESWCKLLRSHANYTASSSLSPAMAFAFLESSAIYASQKKILCNNIIQLHREMHGNDEHKALPIFPCGRDDMQQTYLDQGIVVSSFHYPYPESPLVSRIVINALHTSGDIAKIARTYKGISVGHM